MFFPAFDNELVSSKLGPFGEAHGEFRPTRLPPLQCAFKSFQDNDIMRKMPVSCCLDKFWERCASLLCFASRWEVRHSRLNFSENYSNSSAVQRCDCTFKALQEVAWFADTSDSSQHSTTMNTFLQTWWCKWEVLDAENFCWSDLWLHEPRLS